MDDQREFSVAGGMADDWLLKRGTQENDSLLVAEDGEKAVTVFRIMQRKGV